MQYKLGIFELEKRKKNNGKNVFVIIVNNNINPTRKCDKSSELNSRFVICKIKVPRIIRGYVNYSQILKSIKEFCFFVLSLY